MPSEFELIRRFSERPARTSRDARRPGRELPVAAGHDHLS
jgi:hypothetical protein